jgi:peptidoglycan/LPS O-acetylase OafA/YrhL
MAAPEASRREPPAGPGSAGGLGYVPALDGLRAVAVMAVLAYHAGFGWARGGFLGVSVFFTLSGFLITTLLLTEHERAGRIDLRRFWVRRIRRLMPAALLTVAAVAVASVWLGSRAAPADLRGDGLAALGNVANWRFILGGHSYADLFAARSPFEHFWSLSIEEQFYVFFPLVVVGVLVAARGRRRVLAVTVAGLAVASLLSMVLRDSVHDVDRLYYGTDTRAFELLAGVGLALWIARAPGVGGQRRVLGVAGFVALLAIAALFGAVPQDSSWLYEGGLAAFSVLSVVVIVAALEPASAVARALSIEPLRRLGLVSYGVYLLHWPVFIWLDSARTGLQGVPLFLLQVSVTFALAAASYRLVEAPVRAGRLPVLGFSHRWWAAPVGMAVVVAVVVATTVGPPEPVTAFDRGVSAQEALADLDTDADRAEDAPVRVLVAGDSVAGSLADGLTEWGEDSGTLDVANFGAAACAVVEGGEVELDVPWLTTTDCGDWITSRTEAARLFEPDVVVMLTGPWDIIDRRLPDWSEFRTLGDPTFDDWLVASYRALAGRLAAGGTRIMWLTAPCAAEIDGPLRNTGAFDTDRLEYLNDEILPRVAAVEPAVEVVDLFGRVCPNGEAADAIEGVADGRPDGVHFSPDGAYALSEWLGPLLERPPAEIG